MSEADTKQNKRFSVRREVLFIIIAVVLLFFAVMSLVGALGKSGSEEEDSQVQIEVTGTLRRVGNEPFTELVIRCSDDSEWYIDKEDAQRLSDQIIPLLWETVSAHGEQYHLDLILANDTIIGTRNYLRNITSLTLVPDTDLSVD